MPPRGLATDRALPARPGMRMVSATRAANSSTDSTTDQRRGVTTLGLSSPLIMWAARRTIEGPSRLPPVSVGEGFSYVPMSGQSEGAWELDIEPAEPKTRRVVV